MDHYKTTHKTDWRRVRWVHDHEYQGLVAGIDATEADTEADVAVAQRELEDLQSGKLVCLGAIVETRCPHCKEWTDVDSLWNIIIEPDQDLEELGSEILEIPEKPTDPTKPEGGCSSTPWRSPTLDEPDAKVLEMMVDAGLNAVVTETEQEKLPDWLAQDMGLPTGSTIPKRKPKSPGLARIVLQFDPDTLAGLRSAIYVRRLSGNTGGLMDAFMEKLIEKIGKGAATWEVKQKKAVD